MHHEQRNSRCNPIPGRCDHPAANDAPNAFQNQCAHGIQKSRLTLRVSGAPSSGASASKRLLDHSFYLNSNEMLTAGGIEMSTLKPVTRTYGLFSYFSLNPLTLSMIC